MIDLELKNVTKRFGAFTAVKDFSIAVEAGEFVSFLGPSGCGKTTTLRMIAGFLEPTEGEIFIQGQKVNDLPPYHRDSGMVFQNYALFPHMTVFDNIAFGLRYRKVPKNEIKDRVMQMLQLVQLPGLEGRRPAQLSGGQQQRIALARALVIKPKLLLFDEPLSNLDAKLREQLRVELRQIQQEVGITSIFVTHDQEEALSLSDRIVVMNAGEMIQSGTPYEIYEKPQSLFVGEFIGQSSFIDGRVAAVQGTETLVELGNGLTMGVSGVGAIAKGDKVKILIRAERISVMQDSAQKHLEGRLNVLKGVITDVSYLGSNIYYYVRIENNAQFLVIDQMGEKSPLKKNDAVCLEIGFKSCLCFTSKTKGRV
ncbi:MAG: ABC transporter ATP-binding protein [Desulfobacterales bacterium]|nr:MAG: ABC transporter ATP-binding protein [Desulfobacterales bacterium]